MNKQQLLVKGITKCQNEKGLTDMAFAEIIGVNFSMMTLIKQGKRQPGVKVLRGLARYYPELNDLILNYLAGEIKKQNPPTLITRIKRYFGRLNL